MPADDGLGFDDDQGRAHRRPEGRAALDRRMRETDRQTALVMRRLDRSLEMLSEPFGS